MFPAYRRVMVTMSSEKKNRFGGKNRRCQSRLACLHHIKRHVHGSELRVVNEDGREPTPAAYCQTLRTFKRGNIVPPAAFPALIVVSMYTSNSTNRSEFSRGSDAYNQVLRQTFSPQRGVELWWVCGGRTDGYPRETSRTDWHPLPPYL
ncbi:hypothetical protein Bbelb_355530 [Branchiostoma belcheri]|nr:hypothetical protein Bbelb_355530 [Branchiostoma belcheri]